MNIELLYRILSRIFFFSALALMGVAFLELAANLFGLSLFEGRYGAGRLIELAGALLIFVITLLLRQIRDSLKS